MKTMPRTLRNRPSSSRRAFTIGELAVVVAILGILAAIAIPTFLGQRRGAQDRNAQSSLRNVETAYRAAATGSDTGTFPALVSEIDASEPAISVINGASTGPHVVSSDVRDSGLTVVLAALSDSGTCWVLVARLDGPSTFGTTETCDAALVDTALIVSDSFGNEAPEAQEEPTGPEFTGAWSDTWFTPPQTLDGCVILLGDDLLHGVPCAWNSFFSFFADDYPWETVDSVTFEVEPHCAGPGPCSSVVDYYTADGSNVWTTNVWTEWGFPPTFNFVGYPTVDGSTVSVPLSFTVSITSVVVDGLEVLTAPIVTTVSHPEIVPAFEVVPDSPIEIHLYPGDVPQLIFAVEAAFSVPLADHGPVTAEAVWADDTLGCSPLDNPEDVGGRILVVSHGGCSYTTKYQTAIDAGAVGLIVNSFSKEPHQMGGSFGSPTIPAVMISNEDTFSLSQSIANGSGLVTLDATLTLNEYPYGSPDLSWPASP